MAAILIRSAERPALSFDLPLIERCEEQSAYEQRLADATLQIQNARQEMVCLRVERFFAKHPAIHSATLYIGPNMHLQEGLRAKFTFAPLPALSEPTCETPSEIHQEQESGGTMNGELHSAQPSELLLDELSDELTLILAASDHERFDGIIIRQARALQDIGELLLGHQGFALWRAEVERARIERDLPPLAAIDASSKARSL